MPLKFVDHYTPQDCQDNPDWLFIFGDNFERHGKGGQAIIRDEKNACGLATKRKPTWDADAFLSDEDYDEWERLNTPAYERIEAHLKSGGVVVWPLGIGMGRANLPGMAPRILNAINDWAWSWVDRYGRSR
jgi:hypothetical protein